MSTIFHDTSITFKNDVAIEGELTLSGATQALPGVLEVLFGRDQINAGSVSIELPAYATVLSTHIEMTTPLAFSGTTTGVDATVGNLDADGLATSTALAGAAGYRLMGKGVLVNQPVEGGPEAFAAIFAATGGAASLAEVSAGAGKVVIKYLEL